MSEGCSSQGSVVQCSHGVASGAFKHLLSSSAVCVCVCTLDMVKKLVAGMKLKAQLLSVFRVNNSFCFCVTGVNYMLLAGSVCSVVSLCFNRLWLSYMVCFCCNTFIKGETSTVLKG